MNYLRPLDIVIALGLLVLFLPLLLLVYLLVLIDLKQPLFLQERVGKNGRIFTIIKFRTMSPSCPQVPTHEVDRRNITILGDILRRTKIDELPQLINVLRGEMSLVGPRPCLATQKEVIEKRSLRQLDGIRPGITGLAQLQGIDMSDPKRLAEADAEMIKRLDLRLYFKILWGTVWRNDIK